eukprot:bmy_20956T0
MTQKDILYRLQSSKAKCIITNDVLAPAVDGVASRCENLHCKLIVSQSPREGWENLKEMMNGTSGSPKMTGHTHSSFGLGLPINGRFWLDLTPLDVMWNTSDTGWAKSAWSSVYSPWIQGACVFAHYLPRFEPTSVLQTLCKFPITVFCSAPTADRILVQNDKTRNYKFKSLKHCVSAGESINSEVTEQWRNRTGLDIHEGYGQTETILDVNGNVLPPGQEGDIGIRVLPNRPFCLFTHYVDNPTETASTLRGNFCITGDGAIWMMDISRLFQEWMISYYPLDCKYSEVNLLLTFTNSCHMFCFPVTELDLQYLEKYSSTVEFIQELPKTISGKIKRNELRKKEWETI